MKTQVAWAPDASAISVEPLNDPCTGAALLLASRSEAPKAVIAGAPVTVPSALTVVLLNVNSRSSIATGR